MAAATSGMEDDDALLLTASADEMDEREPLADHDVDRLLADDDEEDERDDDDRHFLRREEKMQKDSSNGNDEGATAKMPEDRHRNGHEERPRPRRGDFNRGGRSSYRGGLGLLGPPPAGLYPPLAFRGPAGPVLRPPMAGFLPFRGPPGPPAPLMMMPAPPMHVVRDPRFISMRQYPSGQRRAPSNSSEQSNSSDESSSSKKLPSLMSIETSIPMELLHHQHMMGPGPGLMPPPYLDQELHAPPPRQYHRHERERDHRERSRDHHHSTSRRSASSSTTYNPRRDEAASTGESLWSSSSSSTGRARGPPSSHPQSHSTHSAAQKRPFPAADRGYSSEEPLAKYAIVGGGTGNVNRSNLRQIQCVDETARESKPMSLRVGHQQSALAARGGGSAQICEQMRDVSLVHKPAPTRITIDTSGRPPPTAGAAPPSTRPAQPPAPKPSMYSGNGNLRTIPMVEDAPVAPPQQRRPPRPASFRVRVENLPTSMTFERVSQMTTVCGSVKNINIEGNCATIEFLDADSADKFQKQNDRRMLDLSILQVTRL